MWAVKVAPISREEWSVVPGLHIASIFADLQVPQGSARAGILWGWGGGWEAPLFHWNIASGKGLRTCSPALLSSAACALCLGWA